MEKSWKNIYLDGPWDKRDSWLVTGDRYNPQKNPTEIIQLLTS